MRKLILLAVLVMVVSMLAGGTAQANTMDATTFNQLSDNAKWEVSKGGMDLPIPPVGYKWAEDLSLIPMQVTYVDICDGTGAPDYVVSNLLATGYTPVSNCMLVKYS